MRGFFQGECFLICRLMDMVRVCSLMFFDLIFDRESQENVIFKFKYHNFNKNLSPKGKRVS